MGRYMQTDLILQQPVTAGSAELLLMLHGVGSSPEDLAPLGQALAAARPQAWTVGCAAVSPQRHPAASATERLIVWITLR